MHTSSVLALICMQSGYEVRFHGLKKMTVIAPCAHAAVSEQTAVRNVHVLITFSRPGLIAKGCVTEAAAAESVTTTVCFQRPRFQSRSTVPDAEFASLCEFLEKRLKSTIAQLHANRDSVVIDNRGNIRNWRHNKSRTTPFRRNLSNKFPRNNTQPQSN